MKLMNLLFLFLINAGVAFGYGNPYKNNNAQLCSNPDPANPICNVILFPAVSSTADCSASTTTAFGPYGSLATKLIGAPGHRSKANDDDCDDDDDADDVVCSPKKIKTVATDDAVVQGTLNAGETYYSIDVQVSVAGKKKPVARVSSGLVDSPHLGKASTKWNSGLAWIYSVPFSVGNQPYCMYCACP